eukprot:734529-Prymnesium_polylepis.1
MGNTHCERLVPKNTPTGSERRHTHLRLALSRLSTKASDPSDSRLVRDCGLEAAFWHSAVHELRHARGVIGMLGSSNLAGGRAPPLAAVTPARTIPADFLFSLGQGKIPRAAPAQLKITRAAPPATLHRRACSQRTLPAVRGPPQIVARRRRARCPRIQLTQRKPGCSERERNRSSRRDNLIKFEQRLSKVLNPHRGQLPLLRRAAMHLERQHHRHLRIDERALGNCFDDGLELLDGAERVSTATMRGQLTGRPVQTAVACGFERCRRTG